jgi:hypothetical protein
VVDACPWSAVGGHCKHPHLRSIVIVLGNNKLPCLLQDAKQNSTRLRLDPAALQLKLDSLLARSRRVLNDKSNLPRSSSPATTSRHPALSSVPCFRSTTLPLGPSTAAGSSRFQVYSDPKPSTAQESAIPFTPADCSPQRHVPEHECAEDHYVRPAVSSDAPGAVSPGPDFPFTHSSGPTHAASAIALPPFSRSQSPDPSLLPKCSTPVDPSLQDPAICLEAHFEHSIALISPASMSSGISLGQPPGSLEEDPQAGSHSMDLDSCPAEALDAGPQSSKLEVVATRSTSRSVIPLDSVADLALASLLWCLSLPARPKQEAKCHAGGRNALLLHTTRAVLLRKMTSHNKSAPPPFRATKPLLRTLARSAREKEATHRLPPLLSLPSLEKCQEGHAGVKPGSSCPLARADAAARRVTGTEGRTGQSAGACRPGCWRTKSSTKLPPSGTTRQRTNWPSFPRTFFRVRACILLSLPVLFPSKCENPRRQQCNVIIRQLLSTPLRCLQNRLPP